MDRPSAQMDDRDLADGDKGGDGGSDGLCVAISLLVVNLEHVMVKDMVDPQLQLIQQQLLRPQNDILVLHPVIRVFGSTSLGQRTCAHIHGVYPYVFFRPENLTHAAFDQDMKVAR